MKSRSQWLTTSAMITVNTRRPRAKGRQTAAITRPQTTSSASEWEYG